MTGYIKGRDAMRIKHGGCGRSKVLGNILNCVKCIRQSFSASIVSYGQDAIQEITSGWPYAIQSHGKLEKIEMWQVWQKVLYHSQHLFSSLECTSNDRNSGPNIQVLSPTSNSCSGMPLYFPTIEKKQELENWRNRKVDRIEYWTRNITFYCW